MKAQMKQNGFAEAFGFGKRKTIISAPVVKENSTPPKPAVKVKEKINLVHRNDQMDVNFMVSFETFEKWFESSDDGFGQMMRPEMARVVWDRAAKRAELNRERTKYRWAISEAFAYRRKCCNP